MRRGENWALPRKDQGPVRALARDYVDSRRSISEYYMFAVLVLVVLLFIPALRKSAVIDYVVLAPALVIVDRELLVGRPGDQAGAGAVPRREHPRRPDVRGHPQHPVPQAADAGARGSSPATRSEPPASGGCRGR